MNLFIIIAFLIPLVLAFLSLLYLSKRANLSLEVFAAIIFVTTAIYAIFFGLLSKDTLVFNLILVLSGIEFVGMLLWPITSPSHFQRFSFKSLLYDGQSSISKLARHIQSSRLLSSCIVFFFYLISFGLAYSMIDFLKSRNQIIEIILIPAVLAVLTAVNWKPRKV